MDRVLNTQIIIRNDTDENWKNSNLILAPGELAISLPTKEEDGRRVSDPDGKIVLKIGNGDTFMTSEGKYGSNCGILTNFASSGTVSTGETEALKIVRDSEGRDVIQLTQAHRDENTEEYIGGVISGDDYGRISQLVGAFSSEGGGIDTTLIENLKCAVTVKDSKAVFRDGDTEEVIYWDCTGTDESL